MIGKFEELTLLALVKAGPDSHAAKVYGEMEAALDKVPPFAALYTALDRMTKKKLVRERRSRGDEGRPKRLFTITGQGRHALDDALNSSRALGSGLPELDGGAVSHA